MSRRIVSLCCLLGLWGGTAFADDQPANLITDPSFEGTLDDHGLPPGWFGIHTMPNGAYEFAVVDEARTGEHALQIRGQGQFGVVWGEKLRVEPGRQYHVRGWVRVAGDADAAADVKLHYYGAGQEYLGQSRIGWVNPRTEGWQEITVTGQTELFPQAQYISIAVALAGNGEAWFDDVELFIAGDEPATINYVANGDMEDVAADRPGGWYVVVINGEGECRIEEEHPHGGQRCLYLSSDAERCAAGSVQIPIEPGKEFELTGYVRVAQGAARLGIGYFKDGVYLGDSFSAETASESWEPLSVQTEFARFPEAESFIAIVKGEGDFAACFDDLQITAVEP